MSIEAPSHAQPHESLPPANTQEHEPMQGSQYKFVFLRHTPENAKAAAQHVEDCEIVAIELVGIADSKVRQEMSEALTTIASSTATEEAKAYADAYLDICPPGIREVVLELEGSDKQIFAIDITRDHPEYHWFTEANEARKALQDALIRNAPNRQLKRLLLASEKASAKSSAVRESLLAEDLRDIATQPDSEQKKIGVLLGGVHTPVQHELSKEARTERVFVDMGTANFEVGTSERARYVHSWELGRQLRLRPDVPVSEALLNRMVVEDTYYMYSFGLPEDRYPTESDYNHAADNIQANITDKMSDEEISALLESLDRAKAGITRRFRQDQITDRVWEMLEANRQMVLRRTAE